MTQTPPTIVSQPHVQVQEQPSAGARAARLAIIAVATVVGFIAFIAGMIMFFTGLGEGSGGQAFVGVALLLIPGAMLTYVIISARRSKRQLNARLAASTAMVCKTCGPFDKQATGTRHTTAPTKVIGITAGSVVLVATLIFFIAFIGEDVARLAKFGALVGIALIAWGVTKTHHCPICNGKQIADAASEQGQAWLRARPQ
ncbi:MAG: hypothetical protein AAF797_18115 [Planctomycetota bacterium]